MKKTVTYLFLMCVALLRAQQDPQYSQYMFNQVIINPAYLGSKSEMTLFGSFRKEWVNIKGTPQTTNLSFSGPLKDKKMGLGGHLTQEEIGPRRWISAYLDYCYRLTLEKGKLSFGISGGVTGNSFNTSKLDLYDEAEPLLYSNPVNNAVRFDMNAGIYYFDRSFYLGMSTTHLTNPYFYKISQQNGSEKFYNLTQHIFITAGKAFLIHDDVVFSPSILIKSVRARNITVDLNANFLIKEKIWLGISARSNAALVMLAQYVITDRFKIGYSYDYGFRGIARASYGSHEIMISYSFSNNRSKIVTSRFL